MDAAPHGPIDVDDVLRQGIIALGDLARLLEWLGGAKGAHAIVRFEPGCCVNSPVAMSQ